MKSGDAQHPHARRRRARGASLIVAALMGTLCLAFFRAQVLQSSDYALQSQSNRLRPLPIEAPRGTVYDRNGRIIADNVPGYSLSLFPAPIDSLAATLEVLRPYLGLTDARIERLLDQARRYRAQPLLVEVDADFDAVAALEERRAEFPGVFLEMRPKRRYHAGPAVSHVLGYVGEITADELESERLAGYEQGMTVGKEGMERQYEGRLQGARGLRYVEVDARGRIVGSFLGQAERPAQPGSDLELNLDLDLTEWIHEIFPDTMRGAVVALDVADGGVLALYSAPTFDPNSFVGGIDADEWAELNGDPARPLFNRAAVGRYAPGSTWKLAVAAIGLDLGVVHPHETLPIACNGGFRYGNRYFRCWKPDGHGLLDLAGAIQNSCNVYFYQLGLRVGLQRLLEEGTRIGFARRCGVDLPRESQGVFPADVSFWQDRFGYRANESEVLSMSIGQGPNDQTPLKMAQFYVAMARNGSAPAPRILRDASQGEGWSLDLSQESLESIREGLRRVVGPGGTAHMSSLEHWDLLGKSGTVQNSQDPTRNHAWFAGIAGPRDSPPEIVVVALVEFGDSGSGVAAPIVAKAADYYLRKRHGIATDTIQTLREHLLTGRPAPWARWEPEPGS